MPKSSQKPSQQPGQKLRVKSEVYDLIFGRGKAKKKKKKKAPEHQWYFDLCKMSAKYVGKQAKPELTEDYKKLLAFLGWKLKPREINSAPLLVMYVGLGLAFLNAMLHFMFANIIGPIKVFDITLIGYSLSLDFMGAIVYFLPFGIALYAANYVQTYPKSQAELERIQALGFIPEIINYLIMAMKVTPNLERAISFAAEHGHGHIARDFKSMEYAIHIGRFKTVEAALDDLAWRWGEYSGEFKHALMVIRASVMEGSETRRNALLDSALASVLEGIKEKMDMYSRAMNQPSIYLYYLAVMLPLLLMIIIPVAGMMGGGGMSFLSGPWPLLLIYNLAIPLIAWLMAQGILKKRPPTREVPIIPDDHPELPKSGWFTIMGRQLPVTVVCGLVFAAIVGGAFLVSPFVDPHPRFFEAQYKSYCLFQYPSVEAVIEGADELLCIPFIPFAGVIIGLVFAASFFLWAANKDKRKLQLEIIAMEDEFQDTLYLLASRLGEGRPMEDALKHASEFMPDSLATKKLFLPTLHNIVMMGMTMNMALFDKAYGSLRNIPSGFLRGTMRIVVDSVTLGVQTAAKSIANLSMQLRDSQKVEKALKAMLSDITNMLSTMCIFIAPVVLGITIALQRIIMGAMKSLGKSALGESTAGGAGMPGMSSFSMPKMGGDIEGAASQPQLLFIITLYMIEVVIILIHFASSVNDGDNPLAFKMALAQALPIAMSVFFMVTFVAMRVTAIGV